ncbi:MAG: hypothetical protein ACR2OV_16110 [Hyphomicrobiaceae bacterium]
MIFKSRPVVLPADRFQRADASGRPKRAEDEDLREPFVWKKRWLARLMQRKWLLVGLVLGGFGVVIAGLAYEPDVAAVAKTTPEVTASGRD